MRADGPTGNQPLPDRGISYDFTARPFVLTQINLRPFLRQVRNQQTVVCLSYAYDRSKQAMALGTRQQPTLAQTRRNEGELKQSHRDVADGAWPNNYLYRNIIGGFVEITARDEGLFAIRIFGFSQTFTVGEEVPEDSAGFDRALIARHLSLLTSESNLNLLDCQTESDNVRLLVRIP